ncbi:MAG: heavy-metal-associated domain-containing protein [Clostridiales bacterium]|nr:heavy-metal-associated domain-containing protein [Clostridiales bacterium]
MKKVFPMEELDCANCAAKIEAAIGKLEGVESANVNFMTQKLTLVASDDLFDSILEQAKRIVKKIEPDCAILT